MSDGYAPKPGGGFGGDPMTQQMIDYIMQMAQVGATPQLADDQVAGAARRMNLGQDTLSNQADQSAAAAGGPGAYGPGAFNPTMSYTPVDQPGLQQLTAYAARPDTPEGIIAAGILQGSTAQAEIAKLQAAYNKAKEAGIDPSTDPVLSQLRLGEPNQYDGSIGPDWTDLSTRMGDLESTYMSESQGAANPAVYDAAGNLLSEGGNRVTGFDANGNPILLDATSTPSEAAQWYTDQGLSLPTDQYMAGDFLSGGQQGIQGAEGVTDQWLQAMQRLMDTQLPNMQNQGTTDYKATLGAVPPGYDKGGPEAPAGPGGPGGPGLTDMEKRRADIANIVSLGGGWLRDLIQSSGGMAGPQTVVSGTDPYGFPTTSSTGGGGWEDRIQSVPADVGQAGLTDLSVGQGVMARLLDNWTNGLVAGGGTAGNAVGGALDSVVDWGSNLFNDDDAAWVRPEDVQAEQGGGNGGNQSPDTMALIANILGLPQGQQGVGNNGVGIGGGGAGGQGAPRGINDLPGPDLPSYPDIAAQHQQAQPAANPVPVSEDVMDAMASVLGISPGQASNTSTRTGPEPSDVMNTMANALGISPNTSTRTGPEPSDTMGLLSQMLGISPNTSTRAGPEPSETMSIISHMLGISPGQSPNTSTRTGPEPSDAVPSWWQQIGGNTEPARIPGSDRKKSNDRRTNDRPVAVRGRSPSKNRAAAENTQEFRDYSDAYDRNRAADRAAGIGTANYGRALAAAYLMGQQGIRPLDTELAARRAGVPQGY